MGKWAKDADPVRILRDLIAIDSVNLGPEKADKINPEKKMVLYLEAYLKRLGFSTKRQVVRAGRVNLIGRLPGKNPRKRLMLEAHMDTVGVSGMTVKPFKLTKKGSRLYARGSVDTKGPMASYLAGIARALKDGGKPPWTILFVATMGEETGCEGASFLAKSGFSADAGLVAEATKLNLCVAHKTALWWKVAVKGKTAHGSTPHLGVSAIEGAAAAVLALANNVSRLSQKKRYPLLTPATAQVGLIQGGEKDNVIPAYAEFMVDSRLLPNENVKLYLKRAEKLLQSVKGPNGKKIQAKIVGGDHFDGFSSDPRAPFLRTLSHVAKGVAGKLAGNAIGASYFSDAGPLAPCVPQLAVFGPGDIALAHAPNEYISLRQLEAGTEIIRKLIHVMA